MKISYNIKFDGGDADSNRIEANAASHSLEGISWALSVVLHYGVTGELRERGDLSRSAKIYLLPSRKGSFIQDLNIFVQENPFLVATVGAYTVNTVTPYINGLVRYTFNQAIGQGGDFPTGAKRVLRRLKGEEVDKLITRIEPPLTRAHAAIGKTSEKIIFRSKRTDLAVLDEHTKAYLEAEPTGQFETIDTNVTSLNLLTDNGRILDPEYSRTEAFSIMSNADAGTKNVLINSMEQYDLGRQGTVRIHAERVETTGHRLKKYLISSAEEIPTQEWVDGVDPMREKRV
ncbi:hypothetical protein JQV19_19035 [Sulfitobacter mediterraneus]|uniref:DUF7946 domain-containing protein n=1 Tax=Sulfitobacter mediterraneus TaxID=83219 RepID=UPI0019393F54|nr:hypothetical protein [Sulfitobacter mediterraneus]MBM1558680.1 hypothetical protein [Sulfitobacter mediterraneus]MBM1570091.1 hypothetical protein [Sulfitobacter mediterraneus]MBM1574048.1 hypothetical protein [Sulfitobacter mediterraneus]MBM1577813.1 hypothetical protein [Sulfitobacter mediterraneus]MBM1581669.1 hypothetical protein [Sulfitobacter mediterraneus]